MVEKEKAQQEQNEGEKSAKKKRKSAKTALSFGDKEYPLPSSQIPISRNLYKKLLDYKLGEKEVAVSEEQFEEYQCLRVERLNSLGATMSPTQ